MSNFKLAPALAGTFGAIIDAVVVTVDLLVLGKPAVGVVGDNADAGVRNTSSF
jgi:hypothetical protein